VQSSRDVSVVIVTYRTPALTLASSQSAIDSGVAQVVVVDNASGDETLERLAALDSGNVEVIVNRSNQGFGSAANVGARHAVGDDLIFLNSDARLTGSALRPMLAELRGLEGRALIGPRLVQPDGTTQRSAGLLPGPLNLTIRALGIHAAGRRLGSLPVLGALVARTRLAREHLSAETATITMDTTMVSGACFAMGREAFWELGGFDERFFMYFEDADLCRRAAKAGMPVRFVPSAVVSHVGGASSEGDYHYSPLYARSMRQYLEKWWGTPGAALAVLLLWLRLVGHALVLHRGTGQAFAALRAALRPRDEAGR
jgi:N-acetylglucosaminyl-diphospho-decaprenol L-rhamnosyltransferase